MDKLISMFDMPHDKALHALYGLIVYNIACIAVPPLIAVSIVGMLAAGKEIYDYRTKGHTSDIVDAIATVAIPAALAGVHYVEGALV